MCVRCVPGSSVGIATDYGLNGPGSNPGGGWDFPHVQTDPGAHPVSCKMGSGSFPGVKCGRGVLLTTHPLLVPRSWKSIAIPLPTLWACNGITLPYVCKIIFIHYLLVTLWQISGRTTQGPAVGTILHLLPPSLFFINHVFSSSLMLYP